MTRQPIIWAGAVVASLAAHAGAAAVLVWVTLPEDMPNQPTPETQLQLAAFQVPRTQADTTEPDAESLSSSQMDSAKLGQGVIPSSQADVQTPNVEQADTMVAQGDTVTALDAAPEALATLAPPSDAAPVIAEPSQKVTESAPQPERADVQIAVAQAVTAVLPDQVTTSSVAPTTTSAIGLQPQAVTAGAAVLTAQTATPVVTAAQRVNDQAPATQTAQALQPDTETASDTPPPSTMAPQAPTNGVELASLAPPSTRASAQLAFPGQGDGPVDPVSLAAFQSFMAPGDLGGAAAEVRDSIAGTLSAIPCARLQARFDPDENILVMTGHVPEDSARQTVLSAMQEKMGADIPVREDLLVLPRPQCGALTGISNVGLPQSTDQITNPLLLGAGTHVREFSYSEGQALVLNIQGADYDAYVYVDFFDAAGNVVHLKPNDFTPLVNTPAKSPLQIGSPRPLQAGEPGLYIQIGPPFGQEIAVAFAASEPLYDAVRPLVEPAEPYLDWLRDRVSLARETNPDFKGEWVYFFISTAPAP